MADLVGLNLLLKKGGVTMTTSPAWPVPATCFNNFTWIFLDATGAEDFFLADNDDDVLTMFLLIAVGGLAGGINVALVKDQDEPATALIGNTERIAKEIDTKPTATRIIHNKGFSERDKS